ncbi:MAG: isoprenylcysteine carboxylmethyltransferase family protein [Caulobacteraceae bacterium]|nr:isoprenylcysteine carboxylmethyltransferase family protein [Caulobacteraceae bacterium]
MADLILPDLQAVQRRRKRVLGFAFVAMLLAVLAVGSGWPEGSRIRRVIGDAGLLLILTAIVGRAWCSLYIGGRKTSELVQEGPYSLCRNPLYSFSIIGTFGALAQTGSLLLALAFTGLTVLIFIPVVRQEEVYLSRAFPEAYEIYAGPTPRFLPDPRLWRTSPELTIKPRLFVRTLLDGLPFLAAWPLFELIGRLHDGPLSPLMRLP